MWLGFAAVAAALAVLVVLQYRWLGDLERGSALARRAALEKYLDVVAKEVAYRYRTTAERVLNLPAAAFDPEWFGKTPYTLAKKSRETEGIARLFVVSYVEGTRGHYYFDPAATALVEPGADAEAVAVWAAISPWGVLAKKEVPVAATGPVADERDPRYRVVVNPITDDRSRLVGLAGMVLDPEHFERRVLPAAIAEALALDPHREGLEVTVRDGRGRLVLGGGEGAVGGAGGDGGASDLAASARGGSDARGRPGARAERPLDFVFTDHRVGLAERASSPARWGRANFLLNLGLSVALGLVLLGGAALALRAAARAMRLSAMKNDFVSNVSHELRTPLSSIRVFGELMRLGRVTDGAKVREYGEYIETESRRLTQLIDNILDFSRIESGRKVYQPEPTDLGEVVAETLRAFEVRLRHQGFRIYLETAGELPPLDLDPGAIGQAVANLVDNAVKYSGDGREIVVRVARERRSAVVAVRDYGIGISRPEQKRIFERFHRVPTGAVHDVRGSGLGLSIVQHIVQAHGGRVTVESEPGRGSTFALHLPLDRRAGGTAAAAAGRGTEPTAGRAVPPGAAPEVP